ncbi:hypothetical protein Pmar_PMAR019505 [Perkinsus marinus ATCC 50983]|uniref:Uncharacterized protein n=1 Tax=Perkinsus marinus (strain ATCC 50983 / TXsc) TaxID=423536 RepID=C5KR75_PERM5|nr:hypothetical protein Pmar_PMAR019505 [Perkinsus marinus ATCC 50983]EER12977.1 hypothetical protein Pmar_PMAR019505 [Perkinsus marinus ATCC 50983]|eukprot:XP_002781182.1 hypothetical protein Pmar_PMAR019505 [Perkinsus marinus ATCC 50983]
MLSAHRVIFRIASVLAIHTIKGMQAKVPKPAMTAPEASVALFGGRMADVAFVFFIIAITLLAVVAFGGINMRTLWIDRHGSSNGPLGDRPATEGVRKKQWKHRTAKGNPRRERHESTDKKESRVDHIEKDVQFNIVHDVRPSSEGAKTEAINELLRITGVHIEGDTGKGIWTAVTRRSGLRLSVAMAEDGTAEALVVYLRVSSYARIELVTAIDDKARKALVKSIVRLLKTHQKVVHVEAIARTAKEKGFWTTEIGFHASDAAIEAQKAEEVTLLETFVQTMPKAERREYNRAREVTLPLSAEWWKWGPVEPRRAVVPSAVVGKPPRMPPKPQALPDESVVVAPTGVDEDSGSREETTTEEPIYGRVYGDDDDDDEGEDGDGIYSVEEAWIPSLRREDETPCESEWSVHEASDARLDDEEMSGISKDADTLSTLRSPDYSVNTEEPAAEIRPRVVPKLQLPLPRNRSAGIDFHVSPSVGSIDDSSSGDASEDMAGEWIPNGRSPEGAMDPARRSAHAVWPNEVANVIDNTQSARMGGALEAESDASVEREAALDWRPSLFAERSFNAAAAGSARVHERKEIEVDVGGKAEVRESSDSTGTEPSREERMEQKLRMSTSFDWAEETSEDEDLGLASPSVAQSHLEAESELQTKVPIPMLPVVDALLYGRLLFWMFGVGTLLSGYLKTWPG